jgi:DNA-binding response OmpR family regulator
MGKLRVLIVDDEEELVRALEERLRLRDIDAHGVTSGAAALEAAAAAPYDVALVDVKMPGVGGLRVAQELRARLPRLQVILLTGHGSEEDAAEGRRLGAFEYLMKPVSIDALVRTLGAAAIRGKASA